MTVRRLVGDYAVVPDADGRPSLARSVAVDIAQDGRIAAVGTEKLLGEAEGEVERVGGLLMPGLVNAHAHTPMTLVRSAGDGLPLQEWLEHGVWPREFKITEDDAFWGMLVGSAEMLLAGVTTSCEMYLHEAAIVRAVRASGARLVITPGIIAALAPGGILDGRLDEIAAFHAANHDPDDRVSVGFGPHSLYDLTPEQVREISDRARELGALMHIHLDETNAEREVVFERDGQSATNVLSDIGALDGQLLGAHGVWLDDDDIAALGAAGSGVAHCPVSNLKLGSGIARLTELASAGVNVGLGTDGPASNDNLDLWEEMKLAPLLARGVSGKASAVDAATAISLATVSGARAIGLHDVGELRVGYRADVVRVDLEDPAFAPTLEQDLLTTLAFAGTGRHVSDVWVDGHRVVDDGRCVGVDLAAAIREVRTRGERLADGGRRRVDTAEETPQSDRIGLNGDPR